MSSFAKFDIDALAKNRWAGHLAVGGTLFTTTLAAVISLYAWLGYNPATTLAAEVPGRDALPTGLSSDEAQVELSGVFESSGGVAIDLPGAWPSFRGPDADNISKEEYPLADAWPESGPEILWAIDVGDGYAAPAILDGRVYLMDYDVENKADALRCLSLDSGAEIWRRSYELKIKRNHGMSRTIPAVTEKYILTLGPKCHVVCLDTPTGDFRWGIDLQKEYGTVEPLWYAGQCPLIDGDEVILAPAGTDTLMMAVDLETGAVNWKTPNPHGWNMSHASVIPMTLLGKKMYVYSAAGGVAAVSAEGSDTGQLLWESNWTAKVMAPSPVAAGGDLVFVTAGYGKGSTLLQVKEENGAYSVETLIEKGPDEVLACEQQSPISHEGLLYGIMPKDAGALKGQFACYRTDGTLAWSSGSDNRFGLGPFLLADGKFFLLDDHGTLTLLDAGQEKYVQLAQAKVLDGHDAWGPIALAGPRMIVRDMKRMVCVNVGAE